MLSLFQVKGESMRPFCKQGDFVLAESMSYLFFRPKVGHLVVARHPQKPGMLLLKRIVREKEGRYWVEGDNAEKSTDSRHFGWVGKENIRGKVVRRSRVAEQPSTYSG